MSNNPFETNSPIAIFDSGLGGLSVAHEITNLLPNESLVYFGDTAHTPWGNKSEATICSYVDAITRFLLKQNCKLIVIACNTAAAVAQDVVENLAKQTNVKVLNVIDPIIENLNKNNFQKVGLIGTKQTISSKAYQNKIAKLDDKINVEAKATPVLVPLIEEGWLEHPAMNASLETYLADFSKNLDAFILGCTHYPPLVNKIARFLPNTNILNSAKITAEEVHEYLEKNNLLRTNQETGDRHFYVSDQVSWFKQTAKVFYDHEFNLEHMPLFT